ncbi:Auxin transport protein BIG [Platanthera guangdongensis]|uniref:Auxin transport protein BIG n=1 Tax=Platanthera guangdongensis TaxID=2320717 RepID=A0ABR2ML85_9ASPA
MVRLHETLGSRLPRARTYDPSLVLTVSRQPPSVSLLVPLSASPPSPTYKPPLPAKPQTSYLPPYRQSLLLPSHIPHNPSPPLSASPLRPSCQRHPLQSSSPLGFMSTTIIGTLLLFILEQLCNMICPPKPEPAYLLILNKAHTQEEFIRGSMTKNPYSSIEIGPLMRDVKNKICHQLDLLGLLEDDYGMELLVAGNIISLDLSISQVYEQVWKKYHSQSQSKLASAGTPSSAAFTSTRDCPPMTVTYRLQGLDGEATEPMIKELDEEREELQDPEVEFAITGAVRECGGLEVILSMVQNVGDKELKSNHEELASLLNLLMYCCKTRENRCALLRLGALGILLETARRAFSVEAMELADGILLIVAVQYLQESFAVVGQAGFRSSTEWVNGLKRPSVPLILSLLRGLSKGHFPTQRCIDEGGILPLLHALEGVAGENEIGVRAENLLDTLADKDGIGDGFLKDKVHKLRHATRDEMRRRALRKREKLLQELGMRREFASDGGERIVVSQPAIEGLECVEEEEDGLACMVCREGYNLRPNEMLGAYSYSKRVNLGTVSSANGRGDCVYTTVSHFNIIHFLCHQEAKRADVALKNPKKEWEGATLRNNETLCNSIFPIYSPSVPVAQYARYVDQYWDNLNALGRADGSRLRLLTYDIVLLAYIEENQNLRGILTQVTNNYKSPQLHGFDVAPNPSQHEQQRQRARRRI